MPYGLPKNLDTPKNNTWMEKCVSGISGKSKRTGKPYTKGEKVAICKVQLSKKGTSEAISETSLREIERKIYDALDSNRPQPELTSSMWISDVFETHVIISKGNDYFKVPYQMTEDAVTFDWSNSVKVTKVEDWKEVTEAKKDTRIITRGYKTV